MSPYIYKRSGTSPTQKLTHLVTPGILDKLPYLLNVATEWVDNDSYCCDRDWFGGTLAPRCIFKYTLDGYGFATYEGTTYKLDRGKALVFSQRVPSASYYYPSGETQPWRFIECEFFNTQEIVEQLDARYGPVYDLGEDHFIPQKLMTLTSEENTRDAIISGAESFRICADIIEEMCRMVETKDNGENGSLAVKARNLIYKQRAREFSLPKLAASLGISPGHLCRVFKQDLNDTPKHYHNELRMKLIFEELINTHRPFKEIAVELGFRDMPSFHAFFKKNSGKTPGEVRREKAQRRRG